MLGRSRSRYRISILSAAVVLALLLPPGAGAATRPGAAAARTGPSMHPSPPANTCAPYAPSEPSSFDNSAMIDNPFLPLPPGTQYVLEGRINSGRAANPHRVTFTITDLVKKIDGVNNIVVHDVDINNGVKREAELSFFAQDNYGTVWNFGEYPEEFTARGQFIGAPRTWISGQNATAGVHMVPNPRLSPTRYLQAYAPDVEFLDCAQVYARGQAMCLPLKCYQNVLVTDETSPLADAKAHQRKHHAPGVGIVQVGAVDDPEGETLVLVHRTRLSPEALAVIRDDALKLEQRAYQINAAYQQTPPAVRCTPELCGQVVYGPSSPASVRELSALVAPKLVPSTIRPRPTPPTVDVTNPKPRDQLTPGTMMIHGIAFDDSAERGLGVDRVSVFLGNRDDDNGALFLGHATLGLASPQIPLKEECTNGTSPLCPAGMPKGDPQFAFAGWSVKTPVLKKVQQAAIYVYARSSVSGVEAVKVVPVSVGPSDEEPGE
jgi:hypothetical protein